MNRFTKIVSLATTGTFILFNTAALADSSSADLVANALIHGDRPAEEAADDARRMPLEVLAFAGIREGMAVLELEAGGL